ncbi:MAG TPA: sulfatase-like hydrolase/transferase, partial [Candidatus Limnocylindrales bacterium]|nr:sulfatase-like hydrolase/transferase [Candidatus Limnocylindrales bacterium]
QGGAADAPPNILLLIADDLGVDLVGAYGEHPLPAKTPVINFLASHGVLFRNAYANPVCSPTRAALITGRECRHTGFGWGTNYFTEGTELPLSEVCIPEALPAGYRRFAIGKWHLGSLKLSGPLHPNLQGFEHFRGCSGIFPGVIGDGYSNWAKISDGVSSQCTTYATTQTVDDAVELIQSAGSDPWFAWVAFNAPHAPFHKPPANLHNYDLPFNILGNIPVHVKAATQAMDSEIGRLFVTLGPAVMAHTIVIFVGDNGTDWSATTAPFDPAKAKGTVYEGGVNVPLIIAGPGIASGAECKALVSVTDIFATIMQLTGSSATAGDSVSLVPYLSQPSLPSLRDTVYVEMFKPNGMGAYSSRQRAVRGSRYKLMYSYSGSNLPTTKHFFDLHADPWETQDLLAGTLTSHQQAVYAALAAELAEPYVAWQPLSKPLLGTNGPPLLWGTGQCVPGASISITLYDARPGAPCMLAVGAENEGLYFKGGLFVPRPDILTFLHVPSSGTLKFTGKWPADIPAGFPILFQYWIQDPAAIQGWAASNGLAATGQ